MKNLEVLLLEIKVHVFEKTTKFCEIFTLLLSYVVPVKSKVKISQNYVALNFAWRSKIGFIIKSMDCKYVAHFGRTYSLIDTLSKFIDHRPQTIWPFLFTFKSK